MRAGTMDRTIVIQSFASGVEPDGAPVESWADFATVRAQKVEASTEEYLRGYGETDETVIIFRIRWLAGVTTDHRVQYDGRFLNIKETKELGRRRGLELRCAEVRT